MNLRRVYLLCLLGVLLLTVLLQYMAGPKLRFAYQATHYDFYYIQTSTPGRGSTGALLQANVIALEKNMEEMSHQALLDAYLRYGEQPEVQSPFPAGTRVLEATQAASGVVSVRFSSEYGELSGISRTVADYAIALTLSQMPQVLGTRIYIDGEEAGFYPQPTLRPGDILLTELLE